MPYKCILDALDV